MIRQQLATARCDQNHVLVLHTEAVSGLVDQRLDAGVTQLFPLTAAQFTFRFDPAKPQERLKFNNLLPYVDSTRAALKYMVELKHAKKPCIMHQDDEYGKNVLDCFNQHAQSDISQPAASAVSTTIRHPGG